MRNFKQLMIVTLLLGFAAVILIFVLENQNPVSLVLLGLPLPSLPIAILVLSALLIGLAVGPILAGWVIWCNRANKHR